MQLDRDDGRRRERRKTPVGLWLPLVAWVAVMLFFSSVPDPGAVLGPDILTLGDAVLHGGGFLLFMILLCRAVSFKTGAFGLRPIGWAFLICAAYGLLDEVHQIFIPGRGFAWSDWGADVGGAVIGGIVVLVVGGVMQRKRTQPAS